jgi:membrane protein DedA with SNARE-associated domain
MKMGMWVSILGILAVAVGGVMYLAKFHRTIGEAGVVLGLILLVIGVAWWTWKDRTAPKAAAPQPAQPAPPTK